VDDHHDGEAHRGAAGQLNLAGLALIAGPAVFLATGVAGVAMASGFFAYPAGFAKPLILFIEAFMTLSIAVTLPMLVAGPPRRLPRR
jgi:hypothetical protein